MILYISFVRLFSEALGIFGYCYKSNFILDLSPSEPFKTLLIISCYSYPHYFFLY